MSTRKYMATLIASTALVLAAPAAIAESPPAAAPDRTEPAGPDTTAPTAAPTTNVAQRPTTPPTPTQQPTTPPTPKPIPRPAAAPTPKHAPAPTNAPTPEPVPQPGTGPRPERAPEDPPTRTPESTPQPRTGPPREPPPQPGTGPTPEPPPQPSTGPKLEPPAEVLIPATPEAAQQAPADASPTPDNGQTDCFLTSAGLICQGSLNCIVTSSRVNCASGCAITSAGFSCPRGGDVLPNPRVSGGPKQSPTRRPTPAVDVNSERRAKAAREVSLRPALAAREVSPTTVPRVEETGGHELPFTGAPLLKWLVSGFALCAGALLLRRRISTAGTAVELSTDIKPVAVLPDPPPRAGRVPSRWARVLSSLALLACGMLLFRRKR
jgi:hypothetical protein